MPIAIMSPVNNSHVGEPIDAPAFLLTDKHGSSETPAKESELYDMNSPNCVRIYCWENSFDRGIL